MKRQWKEEYSLKPCSRCGTLIADCMALCETCKRRIGQCCCREDTPRRICDDCLYEEKRKAKEDERKKAAAQRQATAALERKGLKEPDSKEE